MDTSFVRPPIWPLLAGGIGAFLLVQTSFGAGAGLLVGDADEAHVLACLAAAVVLGVGLWFRHPPTLLFGFPAALLVAIHTMPPEVRASTYTAVRWVPWVATLVAFETAASAWLSGAGTEQPEATPRPDVTPIGPRAGAYTWLRIAAGVLLLVAPAAWLVVTSPEDHFTAERRPALVFAHLSAMFGGVIALHAFVVAPLLDAERDRRLLAARRDLPLTTGTRLRRRLGWALLAVVAAAALVALALRR